MLSNSFEPKTQHDLVAGNTCSNKLLRNPISGAIMLYPGFVSNDIDV
jgi:hypothetical protein